VSNLVYFVVPSIGLHGLGRGFLHGSSHVGFTEESLGITVCLLDLQHLGPLNIAAFLYDSNMCCANYLSFNEHVVKQSLSVLPS
jgi:hypothetical protein